jgi:hypothetical protein
VGSDGSEVFHSFRTVDLPAPRFANSGSAGWSAAGAPALFVIPGRPSDVIEPSFDTHQPRSTNFAIMMTGHLFTLFRNPNA